MTDYQNDREPVRPFSADKAERGGYIPFPQILIDEVMPVVGSNSWRLLCFIIRKTIGWHKDFDIIDYKQIEGGIGIRSPNAIAEAIQELRGYRPQKDGRRILGWDRIDSLPELIIAHPGPRKRDGKVGTTGYSLNPDVEISPSMLFIDGESAVYEKHRDNSNSNQINNSEMNRSSREMDRVTGRTRSNSEMDNYDPFADEDDLSSEENWPTSD